MKTTKKLIILCLVAVMGIVAVMPSTFSWYDHNGSQTGDRMNYNREKLPVSAGAVTMETKKFKMDGNQVYYDEKGNKEYDGDAIKGSVTVPGEGNNTQYFGTTFTNTGTAPTYVNLYLSDFTNNPKNFIGTTAPSLTDKGISSSVHLVNKDIVRVYFQYKTYENKTIKNWNSGTAYVVYKTLGSSYSVAREVTEYTVPTTASVDSKMLTTNRKIYYADLDPNTTEFYFATDGGNKNLDVKNLTTAWFRTKTIRNIQAGMGYYLTNSTDDTTFNASYGTANINNGVSLMTGFDEVYMSPGQRAYVNLIKQTNYTGASVTYSMSATNISVNSNTGLVTANEDWNGQSVEITTTIKGSLGDTLTYKTVVSKPATLDSATVSMNIKVPGATTKDGVTTNGTAEVVWYIRNESGAGCSFSNIYYTK